MLFLLAVLALLPGLTQHQSAGTRDAERTKVAFDASLPMLASALKLDDARFQQRHAVLDAERLVMRGEIEIALSQPIHGVVHLTAPRRSQAAVEEISASIQRHLPGLQISVHWAEASASLADRLPFAILGGLVALCLLPGAHLGQALTRRHLAVQLATRGLGGLALSLILLLMALARDGAPLGLVPWAFTALACLLLSFGLAALGQGLDRVADGPGLRWALWGLAVTLALTAASAAQLGWQPALGLSPASAALDLLRGLLGGTGFAHPPAMTIALLLALLAASPLLHPASWGMRSRPGAAHE